MPFTAMVLPRCSDCAGSRRARADQRRRPCLGAVHQPDGRAVPATRREPTTRSPTGSTRPTAITTAILTPDEMKADADRFFAVLDPDHDGEIDPDELDPVREGESRPRSRSIRRLTRAGEAEPAKPAPNRPSEARARRRPSRRRLREPACSMLRHGETSQGAAGTGCSTCPSRSLPPMPTSTAASRSTSFARRRSQRFQPLDLDNHGFARALDALSLESTSVAAQRPKSDADNGI